MLTFLKAFVLDAFTAGFSSGWFGPSPDFTLDSTGFAATFCFAEGRVIDEVPYSGPNEKSSSAPLDRTI